MKKRRTETYDNSYIPTLTPVESRSPAISPIKKTETSSNSIRGPTKPLTVKVHPVSKTKSLPQRPTASRQSNKINIFDFKRKKNRTDQPWIHKHIPYKVCNTFVKNPGVQNGDECFCGGKVSDHIPGFVRDPSITDWIQKEHTVKKKGHCFGKIRFVEEDGTHQPDFVRISNEMMDRKISTNRVLELLEKKWELPKPNLLISVTGGAQEFTCPPELEKRFKRGLAKAAKSTSAWIFTGGTNTGVMKLVGEAVRGTSFGSQIITIGVATWGIIRNREQLVGSAHNQKLVRDYETKKDRVSEERRGAFLDPNHTHFLLVDNGTHYKYGKEILLRAKLEQKISETYGEAGSTLPQICILVEGGPNSIKTLLETVRLGNPGLVIAGSGRSADVLAEAYRLSSPEEAIDNEGNRITVRILSENNKDELNVVITKKFPNSSTKEKDDINEWICELLKYEKLLTIYELTDSKEFDLALLGALIRGNRYGTSSLASMRLAITWNRPKLAETIILPSSKFTEREKSDLLRIAICQDKPVFIQMMLDQGVDMKYFLTCKMFADLFDEIDKQFVCFKSLRRYCTNKPEVPGAIDKITLTSIGKLMEEILEGTYQSHFTRKEFVLNSEFQQGEPFENPYDMMVIYAVFVESHAMAKLFWERSKTPIATGLIAFKINTYLAEVQRAKLKRNEENEKALLSAAADFESLAVGVMNQCFKDRNHQKELWLEVMQLNHGSWGNLNLIELAGTTEAINFISQGAMQTYLSDIWLGQIHAAQHWLRIFVAAFIPIIGPLFVIRYQKCNPYREAEKDQNTEAPNQNDTQVELTNLENGKSSPEDDEVKKVPEQTRKKRKITPIERLIYFYSAPIVKFQYYCIIYLVFLGTFVYNLIFLRPNRRDKWVADPTDTSWIAGTRYSGTEIFLLLYVLSTIPIEIQQIAEQVPKTLSMKVIRYLQDVFNVLDVLGILSFLTGFILKSLGDPYFPVPVSGGLNLHNVYHLLMILCFLTYCMRLVQMFRINQTMGPKIIMIGKMMIDLFFFIFLMMIFLTSYGVCAQALMNPNQGLENPASTKTHGSIVFDIIFRPYLHVFGELDLDGMNDEIVNGHCDADKLKDGHCDLETIRSDTTGKVHYYLVMGLMALYLLFVNILLLNLLIAIFSKSYEDIQAESDTLWKVQRSLVIHEYRNFSILPQPFSMIVHFGMFVKFVTRRCTNLCTQFHPPPELDETAVYRVSMIEAESREEYQLKLEDEDDQSPTYMMREVIKELDFVKTMISESSKAQKPSGTQQTTVPVKPATAASKLTRIKPQKVHFDSRKSPYPGSTKHRFNVPDDKVNWLVRFPEYTPVKYTAPDIESQTRAFVDPPDIGSQTQHQFNKVNRSTVDKRVWIVDRTSHHGKYNVIDDVPQNPKGRTGIVGRGSLERWGPNHAADTVVTRWHRDEKNEVVKIENKPVLEFVAILRQNDNEWAIPGGLVKPNEKVFETIKREFSEEALAKLTRSSIEQAKISEMVSEHFNLGITVYKGYVDDPRNTDNAWIETIAVNYHDSTGTSFSHFPLQSAEGGSAGCAGVQWIQINHNLDLYASHEWIIEKVCYHRDAYNPIQESSKRKNSQLWMTGLS